MRRGLIGGGVLAVLWFAFGWASFALQRAGGSLATLGQLVPSPMRYGVLGLPVPWAVIVQLLTAAVLIAGYAGSQHGSLTAGGSRSPHVGSPRFSPPS